MTRHVALLRSPVRLVTTAGLRMAVGGAAVWTGLQVPGVLGTTLVAAGAVVLAYAAILSLVLATARLEVRPGELHLVTAVGRRRYRLARGPLNRLALRRRRGSLAVQVGFLGLMLGRAQLSGEELAGVVSLGKTDALVLVPTTAGRLGIAPRSEDDLIDALRDTGDVRATHQRLVY